MRPQGYRKIEAMGTNLTPEVFQKTQEMFAPLAFKLHPEICQAERDIAYGPDPRNRLDIFAPVGGGEGRAVLLFVHGGGFVRGDKGGPDDPFYNNVGAWASSHGLLGATMTYRLAPDSIWPSGAHDVAAALAWLKANIRGYGGSPDRIVLMGQSAGAVHVANYLAGHHGSTAETFPAAAVMVSGLYDMTRLDYSPFEQAYFGANPANLEAQSSLDALTRQSMPLLFSVSEYDPDHFQAQAKYLTDAFWTATGRLPRMLHLAGQNHLSPIYGIGLPDDDFGPQLLNFIIQHAGASQNASAGPTAS